MNRKEFMKELEYLLQDIPDGEKEDALAYYRDYLEDAGDENEVRVIQEFGSPERVAAIIRSDLNGSLEEGGAFTEAGYRDERFRDPNYQVAKRQELLEAGAEADGFRNQDAGCKESRKDAAGSGGAERERGQRRRTDAEDRMWLKRLLKVGLLLVVLAVAAPLVLGVGGTALGLAAGAVCLLAALVVLVGVLTVTAILGGVALVVTGAGMAAAAGPGAGILVIGSGILALGLGLFGIVLSALVYGRFIPWCIRSFVDFAGGLLRGGRRKGL
ncbi:MAG: hypothetical protein Q4C73_02530 [Eubacteriales bacterium]|nr:hypothetical protein [Eubacteriales bacterium]